MIMPAAPSDSESSTTIESAYSDQPQFNSTISDAAEDLTRLRWFRWEREILAVGGIALLVLTVLKGIALLIHNVSERFMPATFLMWAWIVLGAWGGLYLLRVTRRRRRILDKQLCLSCGRSLIGVPVMPTNIGFCPACGTMFTPGEYVPPARCIAALRAARARTYALFPPAKEFLKPLATQGTPYFPREIEQPRFLYEDRRHFHRVIRQATARIYRADVRMPCISVYSIIPWLIVVCILGLVYVGKLFLLILPAVFLVGVGAVMYECLRFASAYDRVLGARRCLGCGHALEHEPLTPQGGGICPQCWRTFHEKEYLCPPRGWVQPDWQQIRATVVPRPLEDFSD